jgi:small-conductance mechanosensitive channel
MKNLLIVFSFFSLFVFGQDTVAVKGSNDANHTDKKITLDNHPVEQSHILESDKFKVGSIESLELADSAIQNDLAETGDSTIKTDEENQDTALELDTTKTSGKDGLGKTTDTKGLNKIADAAKKKVTDPDNKIPEGTQIARFIRPMGIFWSFILILIMAFILKFMHRTVERMGKQFTNQRLLMQKIETFVQFCIYMGTALCCFLLVFEVNEKLLTLIGGTMALSLGFAVKDLVASFIAGITIMIDVPFQVGDRVNFNGHYGDITAIGLRSVRMQTLSDDVVTIPNNKFLSDVTICGNYGELSMQVVMEFYIGIDQDAAKARKIVNEAAASSHYTHLPKPIVVHAKQQIIENYMSFNITLKAYVLDTQYEKLFVTDVNLRVMEAFKEAGIQPPAILHRNV